MLRKGEDPMSNLGWFVVVVDFAVSYMIAAQYAICDVNGVGELFCCKNHKKEIWLANCVIFVRAMKINEVFEGIPARSWRLPFVCGFSTIISWSKTKIKFPRHFFLFEQKEKKEKEGGGGEKTKCKLLW